MYKIKIDDTLIYDLNSGSEDLKLLSPKLSMEVSEPGTLEFVVPSVHRYYSQFKLTMQSGSESDSSIFKKMLSLVEVYFNDQWLWAGRIVNGIIANNGQITIVCEGALGFLKDKILNRYWIHPNDSNKPAYISNDKWFIEKLLWLYRSKIINSDFPNNDYESKKIIWHDYNFIHTEGSQVFDTGSVQAGWGNSGPTSTTGYIPRITSFKSPYALLEEVHNVNEKNPLYYKIIKSNHNLSLGNVFYLEVYSQSKLLDQNVKSIIKYGENLLDLSININSGEVYTIPIPKGPEVNSEYYETWGGINQNGYPFIIEDDNYDINAIRMAGSPGIINGNSELKPSDFSSLQHGEEAAFNSLINKYGRIEKILEIADWPQISGGYPWDRIKNEAIARFGQYLRDYIAFGDVLPYSFTISAIDLASLGVQNAEALTLFDVVEVNSSNIHEVYNKKLAVMAMDIELDKISHINFTFSDTGNWKKPRISRR